MNARVPILVVGGFLGSGKTTLVRILLANAQDRGLKMAVISNEFGELGIDSALLGAGDTRMIELAGGCVCCELSDELVDTLLELRTRVDPDRIVIECSGLALPFDTQLHLYRPEIREWLGDEATVVVVDAERWDETDELFEEQLQSADLVLLSKCDLVEPNVLHLARERLTGLLTDTPVVEMIHGNVSVGLLFPEGPQPARPERSMAHDHTHHHSHDEWESFELAFGNPTTAHEVEQRVLSQRAVRAKGFVRTSEGIQVVQGVGRRIEIGDAGPNADQTIAESMVGRVVVIRRAARP